MEKKEYWVPLGLTASISYELRTNLALRFLESNISVVAGDADGENSVGRLKYRLQSPKELVARCFALADEFVILAESRNSIREVTKEEVFQADSENEELRSKLENERYNAKRNSTLNKNINEAK